MSGACSVLDLRTVPLETGVTPLANGSAKLNVGKMTREGGTEVLAAVKVEVEDVESGDGVDGRAACSVTWYLALRLPSPLINALDKLQHDLTVILQQPETVAHRSWHMSNLTSIPRPRGWLLNLDAVISGNIVDALFMAARAALWDTKVPRTRAVEYQASAVSKTATKDT